MLFWFTFTIYLLRRLSMILSRLFQCTVQYSSPRQDWPMPSFGFFYCTRPVWYKSPPSKSWVRVVASYLLLHTILHHVMESCHGMSWRCNHTFCTVCHADWLISYHITSYCRMRWVVFCCIPKIVKDWLIHSSFIRFITAVHSSIPFSCFEIKNIPCSLLSLFCRSVHPSVKRFETKQQRREVTIRKKRESREMKHISWWNIIFEGNKKRRIVDA